jgi:hypothetical protein
MPGSGREAQWRFPPFFWRRQKLKVFENRRLRAGPCAVLLLRGEQAEAFVKHRLLAYTKGPPELVPKRKSMKRQLSAILLASMAMGAVHAEAEVYLCVGEDGSKEYKNVGVTKGCKKVDLPGVTLIPAPARKPAPLQAAAKPDASPGFPKVDSEIQKRRDDERLQILTNELNAEQRKLADLEREYNNGQPERRGNERNYAKYQDRVAALKEELARTERNIEALRREIGNLK